MKKVSTAAAGMFGWVQATLKLYEINKTVEPLKKNVEEMTKNLKLSKKELQETE